MIGTDNLIKAIENFDISLYLDEIGVDYKDSGKNIGADSLGICCPLCGDNNFHLNINVDKKFYNCWKCGDYDKQGRGSIFKLFYLLEGLDKCSAYEKIIRYFSFKIIDESESVYESLNKIEERWNKKRFLPVVETKTKDKVNITGCFKLLSELNSDFLIEKLFLSYIRNREFSMGELMEWGAVAYLSGKFAMRLVFPLYRDGKIVNYCGRDVTGKSDLRYLNCSNDDSIIPMKELLFGMEYLPIKIHDLILVEGIFDAIRVGKGRAIASMGLVLSDIQKELIYKLNPNRLFLMFDDNTWFQMEKIKSELGVFINNIKIIKVPYGKDPAEMRGDDIDKIIGYYRKN